MPEPIAYKQSYSWTENDFGPTEIIVVVSDAFEGLYSETLLDVNVIELDGIQQSIKGKNGGFEENELTLITSDLLMETVDDSDFIQFMKEAESINVRRFIGVFFDSNTTENLLFHGTVQREIEAEDLIWHGLHFNSFPDPKRTLKFKVTPYRESVFGAYTVEDLIEGNEDSSVPGFDSTWEEENVRDVKGYAHFEFAPNAYGQSIFDVRTYKIVNLSDVLRKLADNLEQAIFNNDAGSLSIKFDEAELDGNWHPARWQKRVESGGLVTRYVNTPVSGQSSFVVHDDDFQRLKINPDGKPVNYEVDELGIPQNSETEQYLKESIFISYGMIKLIEGEFEKQASEDYRFTKAKSFFDLLNVIAVNFGCFVKSYWATNDELRISFTNRNENIGSVVYLKTSLSGKLQPSGDIVETSGYKGVANYKTVEGFDINIKDNFSETTVIRASTAYTNLRDSNYVQLLLTISPTVTNITDAVERGRTMKNVTMPHNHIFYDHFVPKTGSWQETRGVHTAIYLYVDKYDSEDDNESEHYYTPAAAMSIKNGSQDLTFHRLSDYLNYLYGYDLDAQFYEYSLELPGFHTLSLNVNGADATWENFKLHNKIFLDNHWWKITQIKWKFASKSVELALHSADKYSFSNPEAPVLLPDSVEVEYAPPNIVANSGFESIQLETPVTRLEVVTRTSSGYTKSIPILSHYRKIAGIALADGETGEYIRIKTEGEISDESLPDLPVNTLMFLRKNDEGINLSNSPLLEGSEDEHVYAIIAQYTGFKKIKIFEGFTKQWVFHPFQSS